MKKILPVAVMTALAGVNSAHAVHVNDEGLGQVLLYPFYTAEGGQDTYINVVNTTMYYKAVKVRILESMNSKEVLDFNLYMSPRDHWSAVITGDPSGDGAMIVTADKTCTVPNALSNGSAIPFRNYEYASDTIDNSIARTNEGYVEVIEMGVIDVNNSIPVNDTTTLGELLAGAIKHVNGVPGSCATLQALWNSSSAWGGVPQLAILNPNGGLYGYGVLIDVAEGTDATYDATALQDFFDPLGGTLHTNPGSLLPALRSSIDTFSIFDQGGVVSGTALSGLDAVSATMMVAGIANDYVLEPTILAGTDWVITFPTKHDYVNTPEASLPAPATNPVYAPFTTPWLGAVQPPGTPYPACESILITYLDREERINVPDDLDFSPRPPGDAPFALCAEANVMTFNSSNVLKASSRTGSDLAVIYDNGWAAIDFTNAIFGTNTVVGIPGNPTGGVKRQINANGVILNGLPAIGFAVQKYVNGDVGGVLSNYAGSVTHKGDRLITS